MMPSRHRHRMSHRTRQALAAAAVGLAVGLAGAAAPARAQYAAPAAGPAASAQPAPAPAAPAVAAAQDAAPETAAPPTKALPTIQGAIDIEELRRLIDLARESGFSDEQIHQITVEDEDGNVVNAWQYLQDYERRKREAAQQAKAEEDKVYLSPRDILKELDKKQAQDLDTLRDKLIFAD